MAMMLKHRQQYNDDINIDDQDCNINESDMNGNDYIKIKLTLLLSDDIYDLCYNNDDNNLGNNTNLSYYQRYYITIR